MEKQIKLLLGNKKYIYGTLRGSFKQPLVIFVHGFTGNKDEHIFFNGARFFEDQGYSSFRFNLYFWKKDARKLDECTLSLHAQDLDFVVDYFKKKGVKKIFVVGHSFGGLTILLSKKQAFDAAILWDPSVDPKSVTDGIYIKELDRYFLDSMDKSKNFDSFGITVGASMVEENKKLKPFELITKFTKPVKIVVAGNNMLVKGGKSYYQLAKTEKDFALIPGASHCFDEDGTEEKLHQETYEFIQRFK